MRLLIDCDVGLSIRVISGRYSTMKFAGAVVVGLPTAFYLHRSRWHPEEQLKLGIVDTVDSECKIHIIQLTRPNDGYRAFIISMLDKC